MCCVKVFRRSILCCVSVLCGRTVWDSYQTDLCLRACGPDRGRYRHHTVRLHPAEHHVQVRLPTLFHLRPSSLLQTVITADELYGHI